MRLHFPINILVRCHKTFAMRPSWGVIFLSIISVYLLTVMLMWLYLDNKCSCTQDSSVLEHRTGLKKKKAPEKSTANPLDNVYMLPNKIVTLVLREFEPYEHDVKDTVRSFHMVFPHMPVLIVSDTVPYPPIILPKDEFGDKTRFITFETGPDKTSNETRLDSYIKTELVLFTPDSVRITQPALITEMVKQMFKHPRDIVAVRVAGNKPKCLSLEANLREWTLVYKERSSSSVACDALVGDYVLMARADLILSLSQPLARPFPQSLFIQTSLRDVQVRVLSELVVKQGKTLFTTDHLRQKYKALSEHRKLDLFNRFGIKKVHQPGGEVQWYGCTKSSSRCFGTVVNDMPEYLYRNRWTPPCCLQNLRHTARHVFKILEKCNVRYWLEGGSLLGAARSHDIIPWDYDVDIGIYKEDIQKCEWLRNAEKQSIIDTDGFVWERATEGDFLRVQFSQNNHLHVDIFPFYSKKGIMTKDTWFTTHKQDVAFPEFYLKPLVKMLFVGVYVYAPNNATKFLELKFGKGAIENPQYPVPDEVKFPK